VCGTFIQFTPDNTYISYYNNDKDGLAFWDITTWMKVPDKINITYNNNDDNVDLHAVGFSSAGSGQLILVANKTSGGCVYSASF